jgi:tight adherence protein C
MSAPLIFGLVTIFASVSAATGVSSWMLLSKRDTGRKRLRRMLQSESVATPEPQTPVLVTAPSTVVITRLAQWIPRRLTNRDRVAAQLSALGYPGFTALVVLSGVQIALAAVLGTLVILLGGFSSLIAALAVAAVGFMLPPMWVRRKFSQRQAEIQNGLPDALDLCIVCLEAGCSLDHAIARTSDELGVAHPALSQELALVRAETQAGQPRMAAFAHFAERTQLDEVRALVGMLVQTDRFGTSVGQALRNHAATARQQRRQRAEERAAKAEVKLVFPLVCFLFPAFYLLMLGPAMLRFVRAMTGDILPALE